LPSTNVIDLTHPFNEETIYWPTAGGFHREVTAEGVTEQGYFYAAGTFSSAEHGGTHIDAPIHFAEGGQAVDEIPVDRLIGPSIVIDVSEHASANPDYQITTEDIQGWETEHRPIPDGSIVFFRTGLGEFWPDRLRYLGTEQSGAEAIAELQFPGLSSGAAEWLVENRNIIAVGIDTPSIDYGQSQLFETHQVLAGDNISVLENVANLEQLPEEGGVVVALPMKIEGGSGGPVRIVAFVP
jgi:kynurenine formamidase